MATNLEVQINLKNKLFMLLTLKKDNPELDIVGLDRYIDATMAEMTQEDVAWVEKIVNEYLNVLYRRRKCLATNLEVQANQKERLFMLMKLRVRNKDIDIKELNDMIVAAKAVMTQEDVSWVEKIVGELQ